MRFPYFVLLSTFVGTSCLETPPPEEPSRWWKGNLHTHSLWSDGDDYPEMVIDLYKRAGYDFLALSDHNVLAEGERWVDVSESGGAEVLASYQERFGDWVEERRNDGAHEVRLKTFAEYRELFDEPGRFLLVQAEEISERFDEKPVHVNATNLREAIEPQGGKSVSDVMQNNVNAVLAQREQTGQPMFPHINHPNYGWALKVEDLIPLQGEKFFEVYNGHPDVHNEGDELRPSTERMWDILLAERLSKGDDVMYGIAVDDAHNYHDLDGEHSNPERGWVMVKAETLSASALIEAMESGNFYASSGVELEVIRVTDEALSIEIRDEDGVTYTTSFIGTRRGYERATEEVTVDEGNGASVLYHYTEDIGEIFAFVDGPSPSYTFRGDEMYVRAKVVSSKIKTNPYQEGELEAAWVQPVVLRR